MKPKNINIEEWHALQDCLSALPNKVVIPFARKLAEIIPTSAVRLRRDFPTILTLIKSHAFLHYMTRRKMEDGTLVAELKDYMAVKDLVDDIVSEGVGLTVPKCVQDTIRAVEAIIKTQDHFGKPYVTIAQVSEHLGLHRSSVGRRVSVAISKGYLKDTSGKDDKERHLELHEALPNARKILPDPKELKEYVHVCTDTNEILISQTDVSDKPEIQKSVGINTEPPNFDSPDAAKWHEDQRRAIIQTEGFFDDDPSFDTNSFETKDD